MTWHHKLPGRSAAGTDPLSRQHTFGTQVTGTPRWGCGSTETPNKGIAAGGRGGSKAPSKQKKPKQESKRLTSSNGASSPGVSVLELTDDEADVINGSHHEPSSLQEFAEQAHLFEAVVKVFCIHTEPNYSLPWQRKRQYSSTSSGFMVTGENGERYLLTNAHSVEYWSQVRVRRRGHDQKFLAQVLAVGVECDIALLTVEDPAFWEDVQPLKFGPLPRLQDAVAVVGYPVGGDTLSVSTGVISRIEVTSYAHGSTELLAVQIDAAINSGNSGGPVFNDLGLCVGIAFQSYAGSDAENIGYIIPTPVIQHFLLDFRRNNTFTGFPAMGLRYQRMESATLRAAYQMGSEVKGVLVRELSPTAPVAQVLKADDVITHFDGVQVSSDGTVPFRAGERISFGFLTSQKFTGNHATVRVLRDGQPRELDIELVVPRPLVPIHLNNQEPSYLVVSGIVFTPCCEPYLVEEYGEEWMSHAPPQLLKLLHKFQEHVDEQVVVLSQVLADETTLGYEDQCNLRLLKFNQQPVRNLRHLADMVYHCKEAYMRFDLDHAQVVILETSEVKAATARVLEAHSVPFQCSKDLREEFQDHPCLSLPEGPGPSV